MAIAQRAQLEQTDKEVCYRSGYIGGGGYIPGVLQNPQDPHILYGRSDVGGVFRSNDGGKSWILRNNGFTKALDHYSQDLILDPKQPEVLFHASGELRAHKNLGRIHRSLDGGDSWQLMTEQMDFFGNGPTRMNGHVLAIHPEDSNIILAGSYSKGLWISEDRGESWSYRGLRGKRITYVGFDPGNSKDFYVCTMGDMHLLGAATVDQAAVDENLMHLQDVARGNSSELFRCSDLGQSFQQVYSTDSLGFIDCLIIPDTPVMLIATNRGVLRSTNKGKSFTLIEDALLPQGQYYQTLARSSVDGTLYTARKYSDIACPIYSSSDLGESWQLLTPRVEASQLHEYPEHLSTPRHLGAIASIACILPDCKDPDKIYFSNFWGVNVTYDRGKNYYGHYFQGMEMTCVEYVEKHPSKQDRVIMTIVDHAPMVSDDRGERYRSIGFPADIQGEPARTLTASRQNPDFFLWSMGRIHLNRGARCYRTFTGDGTQAELVFCRKGQSFITALRQDLHREERFWLLNEGSLTDDSEQAGLYRSDDFGTTWTQTASPYPDYMKRIPHKKEFIEQDFITIVPYQFKNGSGTNKHLCGDSVRKDTIYLGEFTEGLYRSDNAGESWVDISEGLPFGKDPVHVLSQIVADPEQSGVIYACFWKAGLWESRDFGESWSRIDPLNPAPFNAVCLAIDQGVVVVACSDNTHSSVPSDLFISFNQGKTYCSIYDKSLGALNFMSISLDAKNRRIYAGTNGNGVFFIDYSA